LPYHRPRQAGRGIQGLGSQLAGVGDEAGAVGDRLLKSEKEKFV